VRSVTSTLIEFFFSSSTSKSAVIKLPGPGFSPSFTLTVPPEPSLQEPYSTDSTESSGVKLKLFTVTGREKTNSISSSQTALQ
jgi:hypothetical protein